MHGRGVALYRVPAYDLAVVDAGPRHAVVAIAVSRPLARAIASAVAEALPGSRALPVRISGFTLMPVRIGTARESLVFRTRNAILNGLTGQASD